METEVDNVGDAHATDSLAGRLADGDPGAPRELVERHYAELYRYARVLQRDEAVAEDAVQRAFERAFGALGRYSRERIRSLRLRPWLYRITLNVVRNLWREQRRETPMAEVACGQAAESQMHLDLEAGPEHAAWLDALEALQRLPQRQRTVLALRYLQDMPYAEISEVTGWPESTCKTLARRGLGRLRTSLAYTRTQGDY